MEFDAQQISKLLFKIAQSFTGLVFLLNMEFAWWEAAAMLILFVAQFCFAARSDRLLAVHDPACET